MCHCECWISVFLKFSDFWYFFVEVENSNWVEHVSRFVLIRREIAQKTSSSDVETNRLSQNSTHFFVMLVLSSHIVVFLFELEAIMIIVEVIW